MSHQRVLLALTTGLGLAATGCPDTSSSGVGFAAATLVAVVPADFLGSVPCAKADGAAQSWVAQLEDVTDGVAVDGHGFRLPASAPASCNTTVAFGRVVPGHRYVADIDVYPQAAGQLKPAGEGSRLMLDDGAYLAPPWTTSCGRGDAPNGAGGAGGAAGAAGAGGAAGAPAGNAGAAGEATDASDAATPFADDGPIMALEYATVHVRGCTALSASGPPKLSVDIEPLLGALQCGSKPGNVATFQASIEGGDSGSADCGDAVVLEDQLAADQGVEIQVRAFEAGATVASWATRCFGVPRAGATLPVTCDPLSSGGAISIDVPGLLSQADSHCAADEIAVVQASLASTAGAPRVETTAGCTQALVFDGLAPGAYSATVTSRLKNGKPGPSALCNAIVVPGDAVTASCDAVPAPSG